jgi:hypothetical protein
VSQYEDAGETGRCIAGRFVVEDLLGRGGMGAVYRVRDQRTGKELALKRGYARDARKLDRRKALLEREYHTLAQLAHPSIIEVYDYGVDDDGPYYTMELLAGTDFDRRGKFPWQDVCRSLCDIASSLAILHSRGLLHRDVSSTNVRCTADGRAKLIDFGAMTGMGVAKDAVGTPPFVAPETLQMQQLDARADLFALGALGYYLLTGRHAFPARRLSELRDLWRSAPIAPARVASDVPLALSNLILQLLSIDRSARPQSAAEVMERLCAIASLPIAERVEVSRAYLSTPTLVGRDPALLQVRRRMLSLVRGEGSTLLVSGASGSGRSRMLDACVLEGKLLGALVLRADASDAEAGDFGVARALCAQLAEALPEQAELAARLSRPVLAHVVDALREERTPAAAAARSAPEHSVLLRELRDFVLALSRGQRLLIAVDDVDRVDEPSAALIAAIAHKTEEHSVLLALTVDRDLPPSSCVGLLRACAQAIELEPLSAEHTEALVRSVFGDVDHVQLLAGRIHALALGAPRATLDLIQHLIDRDLVRYAAGRWSLPHEVGPDDLPDTASASLTARVAALGGDARELCQILCLGDGDSLALADYALLTDHRDPRRVFGALDELVAARVLVADAERYRFSQRGFLSAARDSLDAARKRVLHARIADLLVARDAGVVRTAHHLLESERERAGVELLCGLDLQSVLPPVELSERALRAAERLGMPARAQHDLRMAILGKAPHVLAVDAFRAQLGPALSLLDRASGLYDYRALDDLPAAERLARALTLAQKRHDDTPPHERVYAPIDAIHELARLCSNVCSLGMQLYDLSLLESLPSLDPLLPLSPALTVVADIVRASKETLRGRTLEAKAIYEAVIARLGQPDRAGFDETYVRGIRLALHNLLGLVEGSMGSAGAERHAQILEGDREHRVNAWRVRVALHLNQGNADEARKCQRRAELLQLQDARQQRYARATVAFELFAQAAAGDLLGVKRALENVDELARQYEGWRPAQRIGQCYYRWLQDDLAGALEVLLPVFELARPGAHPYFCYAAAAHINLLTGLGHVEEAIAQGRAYSEVCERENLATTDRWVYLATAVALAADGQRAPALQLVEGVIASSEALGMGGLSLGAVYEARARIAIALDDRPTFERFAERCAAEYKKGNNPALIAKFARLLRDAEARHFEAADTSPQASELLARSLVDAAFEAIQNRFGDCLDQADRARCALTTLLQSVDSFAGHLYGVRADGSLHALASLPEAPTDPAMRGWLEESLQAELDSQVSATATAEGDEPQTHSELCSRFVDEDGRAFEPLFLVAHGERVDRIVAALAVHVEAGARTVAPKELLSQVAAQLLKHGDVDGIGL